MKEIPALFARLSKSKFRARIHLRENEQVYMARKGIDVILAHASAFVATRLAPAHPPNDGKQTPWRGHPVFVAQHGTATCCRSCLEKWHAIPKGRELADAERRYIVEVIAEWLRGEINSAVTRSKIRPGVPTTEPEKELELF